MAAPSGRRMKDDIEALPIIDVGKFTNGTAAEKAEVVRQLGYACENIGFFLITNTGVSEQALREAWDISREFFDLPTSQKQEVPMTHDYPYGYSGMKEEVLSESKGVSSGADLKESFQVCIGSVAPGADFEHARWPSNPPTLGAKWTAYYREMEKLANTLLSICALALGYPENWFEDKIQRHRSAMRCLNYPDQKEDPEPNQLRASAHTDYGTLTLLKQDNAPGGLQVLKKDGTWFDVKTPEGAYVINLGDLMMRWTNDRWVSTTHRVINPPRDFEGSTRRQSLVFFHNLNSDAVVEVMDKCITADRPAAYPPITAHEYLMSKHNSAQKY